MFDKFKELILTGLGILAALAVGAAVILYIQLGSATETIANQKGSIDALRLANTANQATIDRMAADYATFNTTMKALLGLNDDTLDRQGRIEAALKRLEQNDEILKDYLAGVLPASVGKLFVEQPRTDTNGDRRGKDPGVVANPVKASSAAADGKQQRPPKADH